ncbi:MAG: phosphoribosylamine--glycine ligase, partial [Thermodesulfobacteriota bacterium]|nr:phosphoribosylamine--glycine ligase [Thermodesulfobacteriota bacterium]
MKIAVIGSGGREHALVWKIAQSKKVSKIYAIPGNGGMEEHAECVPISVENIAGLRDFALKNQIDLTVVGPELPLTLGIVDTFQKAGLCICGPSKAAAQIEGSKGFAKSFMKKYGIPTADFGIFTKK